MFQKKTRKCEKIRSKRRIVGIRSDQGFREAMAVMVKQRVKKRPKGIYQTVAGVLLTPILEPSLSCEWHSHLK